MSNKLSFRIDELLFYAGFIPYLIVNMLSTTMFPVPAFLYTIARLILILSGLAFFAKGKIKLSNLVIWSVWFCLSILIYRATGNFMLIELSVLLLGASNLSARRIITVYLVIISSITMLAFVASLAGIIPNLRYIRPDTGIVRNSFGSIYPTDFAAHIFYLYIFAAYLYFEKKPWLFSGLGVTFSVFLIKFTDARLDSLTLIGAVIFFIMVGISKEWVKKSISLIGIVSTGVTFVLSYWLTLNYNSGLTFYKFIDSLLSGRLYLGKLALDTYGFTTFGQYIQFIGNGGTTEFARSYNFVDSSFLKMLLIYGTIFTLFFVLLMTVQSFQAYKTKNIKLTVILIVIVINSMIAHHLVELHYNLLCVLFFADFSSPKLVDGNDKIVQLV